MSTLFNPPTGFPESLNNQAFLNFCAQARVQAQSWGCQLLSMPVLEAKSLYTRNLGDSSDIVSKEMFELDDEYTLRPEGTSSVLRMWLNAGGSRYGRYVGSYVDTMYRKEKPQADRFRQFTQFGVEVLSPGSSALEEIEWLIRACAWLSSLNLTAPIELRVNQLGSTIQRNVYINELRQYFDQYRDYLDMDDQNKLQNNPLRLLDSKKSSVRDLLKNAPRLRNYLSASDLNELDMSVRILDNAFTNIRIVQDDFLVRGLDYYSGLVYEWVIPDGPAQNAIGAGGRYDGLVKRFTQREDSGFGFAFGLERVWKYMPRTADNVLPFDIWIVWTDSTRFMAYQAFQYLLKKGFRVGFDPQGGKWGSQFQRASKNACNALVLGDQELLENRWRWKDLASRMQTDSPAFDCSFLDRYMIKSK